MPYLDHEAIINTEGYSYDPLSGNLRDRLRLELGDTDVSLGSQSACLSDAELDKIILIEDGKSFNKIKMKALEIVIAKLSYEVTFSVDGMSYHLSDRLKFFKEMLSDLKKTAGLPPTTVLGKPITAFGSNQHTNHYFYENMITNDRRCPSDD